LLSIHFSEKPLSYDGSQLSSHFALRSYGVKGDSLVAFTGAMDVAGEHMADLEDLLAGCAIRSSRMLHFIAEFFDAGLEATLLKQRLLARLAARIVSEESGRDVRVVGDDLYGEDRKLSVSIAAPSPVSCLIHFGMNIETRDVPVKAVGLEELEVDARCAAERLMRAFQQEMESLAWARAKVRGVP